MSGPLPMLDLPGDVRVCARCGTCIVTLAAAVRLIWADITDDVIPAEVVEQITAPVADVWVDVLCNPSCPPGDHEPYPG
ncbi:hypothetical protein OG884_04135 [Streptosporangium sp. NBC_01755]|uniref:hypothetical protein n=1 Tax=unclassified Streptosporangium TaxID=2632669 RepID=UPI002DDC1A09|nr:MULTISPECIES: hypothetical protein [unclassified Streptosporangium]WSA27313.1 hypothetical protein OIE13_05400 [Streptosporangium sp. NBC_01810]WSD01135.1 hypothetical protein OG884_04135 [Streptosporangium sp. NBC_01755]